MPFVNNEVYIISHSKKHTNRNSYRKKNKLLKHTKKVTNNTKLGSFHHHRWTHQQAIFSLVVCLLGRWLKKYTWENLLNWIVLIEKANNIVVWDKMNLFCCSLKYSRSFKGPSSLIRSIPGLCEPWCLGGATGSPWNLFSFNW